VFIKQNNSKSSLNTTSFVLFTDWALTVREERKLRVFDDRVLRGMFGAKRDEVTGDWRKLHNEKVNDLYCEPKYYSCGQIEEMSWTGSIYGEFWWGNLRERDHLLYPDVDVKIILRWIFRKLDVVASSGLI